MTDDIFESGGAGIDADAPSDVEPRSGGPRGAGAQSAEDWRATIEDDRVRQFAERAASPADLAKIGYDLRQKLGKAVVPPGPDAGEDEVAAYRRQIGVPGTPDDYEINRPDDLPDHLRPTEENQHLERAFLEVAHDAGLSQGQLDAVLGWYYGEVAAIDAGQRERQDTATGDGIAALRREWGRDFDGNVEHARHAAQSFGGESFATFLDNAQVDGAALGNHPAFVRTFAEIGRRMGGDSLVFGFEGAGGNGAGDRHTLLTRQIHDAQERGDTQAVEQLSRQRSALSERLTNGQPVVGHGGRAL